MVGRQFWRRHPGNGSPRRLAMAPGLLAAKTGSSCQHLLASSPLLTLAASSLLPDHGDASSASLTGKRTLLPATTIPRNIRGTGGAG